MTFPFLVFDVGALVDKASMLTPASMFPVYGSLAVSISGLKLLMASLLSLTGLEAV